MLAKHTHTNADILSVYTSMIFNLISMLESLILPPIIHSIYIHIYTRSKHGQIQCHSSHRLNWKKEEEEEKKKIPSERVCCVCFYYLDG